MSWMTAQSCELEQAMSQQLYNKRDTRECLLSCSLVTLPVYSMRQGQNSLTHKHAPMTAPRDLACVRGMKINRHWSRHAFRNNPKAQYTFKSLLVHGILQFTMLITLRCALHRCSSRDIRRWKLCSKERWPRETTLRNKGRHICVVHNNDSFAAKVTSPMLLHYPRTDAPGCG